MYRQHASVVLECGVDWVTATTRNGANRTALANRAEEWLLDRACEGFVTKAWNWNSYAGSMTDGISYGRRDDGFIVRLSGDMARRHWATTVELADNVSRFDLQTTVHDDDTANEHAFHWYSASQLDPRVSSGLVHLKYIENTPRGSSFYIGSRSSDRMFRVYDKGAETDGEYPPGSLRYEIEYKGDRAGGVARRVLRDPHPTQGIFDCLVTAYDSYHIRIPAERPAWSWRDAAVAHVTDDQRRLEWLSRCIRPVVGRLSEAFGTSEVLRRLGIYDEVDEITGEIGYTVEMDNVESVT